MIAIFGETRIAYPRSILYPSSSTNILAIHQSVITFFIFRQIISVSFNNTWPSSSPLKQNYFYFAQISYNEFLFLFFVIFKQNFKLFFFAQISYNETSLFFFNNERFVLFHGSLLLVNFRTFIQERKSSSWDDERVVNDSVEKIRTDRERWPRHRDSLKKILVDVYAWPGSRRVK